MKHFCLPGAAKAAGKKSILPTTRRRQQTAAANAARLQKRRQAIALSEFSVAKQTQINFETGKEEFFDETAINAALNNVSSGGEIIHGEKRQSTRQNHELREQLLRATYEVIRSHSLSMDFMQSPEMRNFLTLFAEFCRHDPEFPIQTLFLGNFTSAIGNRTDYIAADEQESGIDWADQNEHARDGDSSNMAEEILLKLEKIQGSSSVKTEPMDSTGGRDAEAGKNSEIEQILQQLESNSPSTNANAENDNQNDSQSPSCHELSASGNDEIYLDQRGKQWCRVGRATEGSAEFDKLCAQHCLRVHSTWARRIHLSCRGKWVGLRSNCEFRGIFLRETGTLFVRGKHNHPVASNRALHGAANNNNDRSSTSDVLQCRVEHPMGNGETYLDYYGKQWRCVGQATKSMEEFHQLRTQHSLWVHYAPSNALGCIINLKCKIRGNMARRRNLSNCEFRGIFLRKTGKLYVRGEHNHPLELDGASLPFDPSMPDMDYQQHTTPSTSSALSNNNNDDERDGGALANLQEVKREEFGALAQFI